MILDGFLNELENLVRDFLRCIKQSLLLIVLPVQSEVKNAYGFPKIAQLSSGSVYHSGNFVGNNELQILQSTE